MEYSGSFEVLPGDDAEPGPVPGACGLCRRNAPTWWYVVNPSEDEGAFLARTTALARFWAICAECHWLLGRDVNGLVERVRAVTHPSEHLDQFQDTVREFIATAEPLREITP